MAHPCDHKECSAIIKEESHSCCHHPATPSVCQTLEELEFERGIWYAAQNNNIERLKKLLKQGTSPDVEDSAGYCALHYAAREGHKAVCEILLNARATVDARTRAGKATALHRAASRGYKEIVELLLKNGAAPELQDADGKTALHRAVEGGHYFVANFLVDVCSNLKLIKDFKEKLPIDYAGKNEKMHVLLQ